MRRTLLRWLVCPTCAASLSVTVFHATGEGEQEEIVDGALSCQSCNVYFVIVGRVPRMIPNALHGRDAFRTQYTERLQALDAQQQLWQVPSVLHALQKATARNFGFEWKQWNAFGWGDEVTMKQTEDIFRYKVLAEPGTLTGKLVLDAGCGNGRYTAVARAFGGEVIGVDLSEAVDVADEHLHQDPKVHIVQGDLFRLPFRPGTFDFIFSNGVLMHTGDARKAFLGLAKLLNPQGAITVHLYHKGNVVYECIDWVLRMITTRLPLSWAMAFSRGLAAAARALPKKFVYYGLNMFLRIEPHPHYVFDWYTAPIATHHTYPEVYRWVDEAQLHLVADHNATAYPWRRWVLPFFFLTVKAQRPPFEGEVRHTMR